MKPLATIVDERQDVNAALEVLKAALPAARLGDRASAVTDQDWNGMVIIGQS
ncbi:MAG: hypothetical protein P4K98_03615 [Bryobacteraceae bacterium]|nr:hypothetical protein [Bryobacteraceae bacterium]